MKLRTIFTLALVLIAVGVGLFFYYQDTIFSEQLLKLTVTAPTGANTGEEITYTIAYRNDNTFTLKDPKLVFELPDNSLTEDGKIRFTQNLKDIAPKEDSLITFSGRILGKEGDVKIARVWLSYMPENLSARYEASASLDTKIQTTPISLTFDAPDNMATGKEVMFTVNYTSDIDYPLENVSIKLQAPSNFKVSSSTPASLDGGEWKLPILQKGKSGTIKIRGSIIGESLPAENFALKLGMWQNGSFVVMKEVNQDVAVIASPLTITQTINNDPNYTALVGDLLNYQITIKNSSADYLEDANISCRLSGRALDFTTLTSTMGQASGNMIIFDAQKNPTLQSIAPGQSVTIMFSVKIKGGVVPTDAEVIKNKITVNDFIQDFVNKVKAPEPG